MLDFCINDKYVTFGIYKNIAREKIPYLVNAKLETLIAKGNELNAKIDAITKELGE